MKISSIVLFIIYCFLMFLPLFSKNQSCEKTKPILVVCEIIAMSHIGLFFINGSYWWLLLLSLLCFHGYAVLNGLALGKIHFLHQLIRFGVGTLIFCLFL